MEYFDFRKMTIETDHIIRLKKFQSDSISNNKAANRIALWSDIYASEYNEENGFYIPLGQDVYLTNRLQTEFGMVPCPPEGGLETPFPYEFFGNPLLIPQGDAIAAKPKNRLTNAGFLFVTHEIDSETVDQFNKNGNWFTGNRADRTLFHQVHVALKCYKDYRGYCVVYSGRRSYHINFKFDTTHLINARFDETAEQRLVHYLDKAILMYRAHGVIWDVTERAINLLNPPIAGDPNMRSAIQWKRAPFAVRQIEDGKAIFGLEAGDCVPQLVIREEISSRAYPGSDAYLIDENFSVSQPSPRQRSRNRSSSGTGDALPAQTDYEAIVEAIRNQCCQTWDSDYPRLEGIDRNQGESRLLFANGPTDKNPSSYVRGDYQRLVLQGSPEFGNKTFWLPDDFSANEIVEFWSRLQGVKPIEIAFYSDKSKSELIQDGRDRGQTEISASLDILLDLLSGRNALLIEGPTGCSKSTSVLKLISGYFPDEFVWENPYRKLRIILFCSTSTEQARKKLKEFEALNAGQGVLFESFMTAYRRTCRDSGTESIEDQFYKQSPADIWQLIESQQPDIAEALTQSHRDMWFGVDRDKVIFAFTSIATLYTWDHAQRTKILNHPDFNGSLDDEQAKALEFDYKVVTCILDDFNDHDIVLQLSSKIIDEIASLQSAHQNWRNYPLYEKTGLFHAHGHSIGCRTFEEFDSRMRLNFNVFKRIAVDFTAIPYGCDNNEKDMYRAMNGVEYGIAAREWIQTLSCPKIFLTTETLMGKIVKAIVAPESLIECNLSPVPGVHPVHVPVVYDNRARAYDNRDRAEDREGLAKEIIDGNKNAIVICNGLEDHDCITNFTTMKGVNEYRDNDVYIIMTMLSPDHYAAVNTLGQFVNEPKIIDLYYKDSVTQAIGRNTGYRDSGNDREAVIIAGSRLINAGHFENDEEASGDPAVVREFITYRCSEKPWLKSASAVLDGCVIDEESEDATDIAPGPQMGMASKAEIIGAKTKASSEPQAFH